jgi:hypothetical protein
VERLNSATLLADLHHFETALSTESPCHEIVAKLATALPQVWTWRMKKMKKTVVLTMLLASGLFATPRVTVGIGFGAPVAVVRPVCPGPGYTWMNGYWVPPAVVRFAPRYEHERAFDHRYEHFWR